LIGHGTVMAIGGNEEKRVLRASLLAAFVRRSGGTDADIVIIPSASVEPEARAEHYTQIFTKLGAARVRSVRPDLGMTDFDRDVVRAASGIFVTGGDQVRLMEHLRASDCVDAIREAVRSGAVYAGTSAGASAVSRRMIAGSKRKKGSDVVEFGEGLGLIPDAIVDQHFGQRRRLSRLITAANAHRLTGIGIDENTAIVWNHDGVITVEGAGEVTIVNPDHHLEQPAACSLRLQILKHGARIAD
jgi:cyanophycinase